MTHSASFRTVPQQRRAALGLTAAPTLDSWQLPIDNRWAFRHIEEMLPSAVVPRAGRAGGPDSLGLERVAGAIPGLESGGLERHLESLFTDALVIEHRGEVVAEYYAPGFGADGTHLLMSVSKSLCSITVASLIDDGLVDPGRRADSYVPELSRSAYGDATVQELLDMTAAADYSEDYTDPSSEVQAQDRAAGWRTPIAGDASDTYEFLTRLRRSRAHGEKFEYCSATTDTLGWIIEAVTGARYAEVLSDRLWSRLGASADARIAVDRGGCAIANAGISCTARDLARIGRLMLGGGQLDGRRIVSERWVAETMAGGDHEKWLGCAKMAVFPQGSYRNQWWSTGNARGNVYAVGIHGQYIWLDPSTDTVITKFSTAPAPTSMDDTRTHAALFEGISRVLEGR